MSLGAWGDEGNVCDCDGYDTGHADGWAAACERIAQFLEGYKGSTGEDTSVSVTALAMSVRAMAGEQRGTS